MEVPLRDLEVRGRRLPANKVEPVAFCSSAVHRSIFRVIARRTLRLGECDIGCRVSPPGLPLPRVIESSSALFPVCSLLEFGAVSLLVGFVACESRERAHVGEEEIEKGTRMHRVNRAETPLAENGCQVRTTGQPVMAAPFLGKSPASPSPVRSVLLAQNFIFSYSSPSCPS